MESRQEAWSLLPPRRLDHRGVTVLNSRDGSRAAELFSNGSSERLGPLPLLNEQVRIDDEDAAVVLVFPRELCVGGIVDPAEMIEDPYEACNAIFDRPKNPQSADTLKDKAFELLQTEPVNAALYQSTVRAGIVRVLSSAGLTLSTFSSIDDDEIFMKISLPLDEEVIQRLAQRYKYKLPLKTQSAEDEQNCVANKVQNMMSHAGVFARNDNVKAYVEYDHDIREDLHTFRHIDAIRIAYRCVDEWLDLAQLEHQNIIIRHFPASQYDQVMHLNELWANFRDFSYRSLIPNEQHEEVIKDYFGERVTFYFHWFAFYTRMLLPLGAAGLLCALRRVPFFGMPLTAQRWVQVVFSGVLCCWASLFNEWFSKEAARSRQRWGMKDWDTAQSPDRPTYQPRLEGTWQLYFRHILPQGFVVLFCMAFGALMLCFERKAFHNRLIHGDPTLDSWRRSFIVFSIKFVSWIWGKLAPWLVEWQNHRTEARKDDALAWTLASVKLFVAIFPFFNICFLKARFQPLCPPENVVDFKFAVWKAYEHGWPPGIPIAQPMQSLEDEPIAGSLDFLEHYKFENTDGQHCLEGCYPAFCEDGHACVTTCTQELESNLLSVYVVHVLCTVLFLVIPIALTKWAIREEIEKVKARSSGTIFSYMQYFMSQLSSWFPRQYTDEAKLDGEEITRYTFMQFQSKCAEFAPYEYYSWGGSQVEDFMELTIGFALLTSFGIHLPVMSFCALLSHIVEYRLVAYRMTNVTCRPMPDGSEGVGVWQNILENVSETAMIMNVASAVFVMHPMRSWSNGAKLSAFLVLEHGLLMMRRAIKGVVSAEPCDVQRIEDQNAQRTAQLLQEKIEKYRHVTLEDHEKQDARSIDVSLGPSAIDIHLVSDVGLGYL